MKGTIWNHDSQKLTQTNQIPLHLAPNLHSHADVKDDVLQQFVIDCCSISMLCICPSLPISFVLSV